VTSLPASERAGTRQRGYHRKTRENDHRETRSGEGEATEATGEGSPSRAAQGRESHSPYSNRRGRSRPCRADMGATSSALLVPQQPSFSSYCLRSHDHRGRDSSDNKTTRVPLRKTVSGSLYLSRESRFGQVTRNGSLSRAGPDCLPLQRS